MQCDERKPICSRCERQKKACEYRRGFQFRHTSSLFVAETETPIRACSTSLEMYPPRGMVVMHSPSHEPKSLFPTFIGDETCHLVTDFYGERAHSDEHGSEATGKNSPPLLIRGGFVSSFPAQLTSCHRHSGSFQSTA